MLNCSFLGVVHSAAREQLYYRFLIYIRIRQRPPTLPLLMAAIASLI
jgi:hypothetical protein